MLARLVDSPVSVVPTADRRALAGQCVEAVVIYLTDFWFCTAHATSPALISEFRTLHGKLDLLV